MCGVEWRTLVASIRELLPDPANERRDGRWLIPRVEQDGVKRTRSVNACRLGPQRCIGDLAVSCHGGAMR